MPEPAPQSTISVGDIRITYLPDGQAAFAASALMPDVPAETWEAHKQLLDDEGRLITTIGGFLVETPQHKVVVDTGFGPAQVDFPGFGPIGGGKLLDSLSLTGAAPGDVDVVIYTHMHLDHTGWTSRDGELTFANARHVVMSDEWEHWHGSTEGTGPDLESVQKPLEGRIDLTKDGDGVVPGITMMATPGHTPGHASLVVSSGGSRAIILGDTIHCPLQIEEPEWGVVFDADPALARRTREKMLAELEDQGTVGGASHLSEFVFGRIMQGQGKRQWTVAGR